MLARNLHTEFLRTGSQPHLQLQQTLVLGVKLVIGEAAVRHLHRAGSPSPSRAAADRQTAALLKTVIARDRSLVDTARPQHKEERVLGS